MGFSTANILFTERVSKLQSKQMLSADVLQCFSIIFCALLALSLLLFYQGMNMLPLRQFRHSDSSEP